MEEDDSEQADELLTTEPDVVTGRHTVVEVRRNLARLLEGAALGEARAAFRRDLEALAVVELDEATCELAATIAEQTAVRTLDALHLAAARRVGEQTTVVTFDLRQAQAARSLGLRVLGT